MAKVMFKGNQVNTNGNLPQIGAKAPDFVLTDADLKDHSLKEFTGKRKLLSVVPSLDTGTCAMSAKKFNDQAKQDPNLVIITISADLPFAQKRFCHTEGVENIVTLSMLRSKEFASTYGLLLVDGPLAGLAARAVLVLDENDVVRYLELVPEITQEPDYLKAIEALKKA